MWYVKNAVCALKAFGRWNPVEEQEILFVRSVHRVEKESWVTLVYNVTKLGLKVIVSNSFRNKNSLLKKLATVWKLVTVVTKESLSLRADGLSAGDSSDLVGDRIMAV